VAADGAGAVYIADTRNNRVRKVDAEGVITTIAGNGQAASSGDGGPATSAAVNSPSRLEVDPFGNLFFLELPDLRERRIDPAGTISTVAVLGQFVGGIALDGAGRPFVSRSFMPNALEQSTWRMQVLRVEPSGALTTVAGAGPGYGATAGPPRRRCSSIRTTWRSTPKAITLSPTA
jgi:hypothetical protein